MLTTVELWKRGRVKTLPMIGFFTSATKRDHYLACYHTARNLSPDPDETRDVPTRFGPVRVYRHGAAQGVPILLIHAFLATSAAWAANVAALAEQHPVYTLDALGQGGASMQVAPIRSPDDHVAWLEDVAIALGLTQVHLVGWSYGGWISFHYARLAPERIATLTLLEPANTLARFSFGWARRFYAMPGAARIPRPYFNSLVDRYIGWMLTNPEQRNPELLAKYEPVLQLLRIGCDAYLPAGVPLPSYPSDDMLRSLQVPVLGLLAGSSNMHDSAACTRRLTALVPQAQVCTWPPAGHALPLECADEVNTRLLEFIAAQPLRKGDT